MKPSCTIITYGRDEIDPDDAGLALTGYLRNAIGTYVTKSDRAMTYNDVLSALGTLLAETMALGWSTEPDVRARIAAATGKMLIEAADRIVKTNAN